MILTQWTGPYNHHQVKKQNTPGHSEGALLWLLAHDSISDCFGNVYKLNPKIPIPLCLFLLQIVFLKNPSLFLLVAEYLVPSLAWSSKVFVRNLEPWRTPWKKTSAAPSLITPGFSNCSQPTPGKETTLVTMADCKLNTARDSTILISSKF